MTGALALIVGIFVETGWHVAEWATYGAIGEVDWENTASDYVTYAVHKLTLKTFADTVDWLSFEKSWITGYAALSQIWISDWLNAAIDDVAYTIQEISFQTIA